MINKWTFYASIALLVTILSSGFKTTSTATNWEITLNENIHYTVPNKHESQQNSLNIPFLGKSFEGFKQRLAFKESQGKYNLVNSFGYMGKYQFGKEALSAIGIKDSSAFLQSPKLQEKAFVTLLALNKHILGDEIKKFNNRVINGILITESGILAAAHLGGAGSVKKYLNTNGKRVKRDGFGTSIETYLKKFGGYDTSIIKSKKGNF